MTERAINDTPPWHVFLIFLRLGLTSFGGPVAHLGYFREEFVARRQWLSERSYADLVALCQFLPGPASSQVGIALGLMRAGYGGALAAWMGFSMPSAVALILFAISLTYANTWLNTGFLHGLKLVAVAVIAQALWGMARTLCADVSRATLMLISACAALLIPTAWIQVVIILCAALIGRIWFTPAMLPTTELTTVPVRRNGGIAWLVLFAIGLVCIPLLAELFPVHSLQVFDAFYRTGSLVFGGGHVVLPLLQSEVVTSGWVSNDVFLAGYGAAQAVPGPLFTFAAFLGASMSGDTPGWISAGLGGLLCLVAIFTPSFLLVAGALPFWEQLRRQKNAQAALTGVNAAVVGLLLAALYQPAWISTIHTPLDFVFALIALIALMHWKLPPWLVVILAAGSGWTLACQDWAFHLPQ